MNENEKREYLELLNLHVYAKISDDQFVMIKIEKILEDWGDTHPVKCGQ